MKTNHFSIYFLMLLIYFLSSSCNNSQRPMNAEGGEKTKTIVDSQNRQDTVYFGYILGQPTKDITKQLINNRDLLSNDIERRTFTMSYGGYSTNIVVNGYPFDLFIADKKYKALLSLYDTNGDVIQDDGKLMSLRIYISGTDKYPIIDALKKQYGETNTPPEEGYKVDVPQEIDAFWNISNKAVYLESFSSFMVLIYEDIIAVRDKNNAEAAAIESEKERNLEQSKKTQL